MSEYVEKRVNGFEVGDRSETGVCDVTLAI